MSIFSWIKGAPKVADNVFDMNKGLLTQVGSWVGGQQFTAEEQAEFNKDITMSVQAFAVATLNENTDRSKARRTIAVEWIHMQVWLIKLYVLAVCIDYLILRLDVSETVDFAPMLSEVVFSGYLWGVTGAVATFFFGTHLLRSSKAAK